MTPATKGRNHAATPVQDQPRRFWGLRGIKETVERACSASLRAQQLGGASMWMQRLMWIAWPAFLMAGVMEMVVFAFVDPEALQWFDQPVNLSREGVYTPSRFSCSGW